ncbi:MAG TPA: deoxyribose-phosphate aldolase [Bacilli bacterium]
MGQERIASYIDHTLLKPDAQSKDIIKLCQEAMEHNFYSVCVNSYWVPFCREILKESQVRISAVCGFPLGANTSEVKAYEAAAAVGNGAAEIDMVIPIGPLIEGDHQSVINDISGVVLAVNGKAIVKVILETALLATEQKILGCRLAEEAGAHYVKTSTGFSGGGATVEDIQLMRNAVSAHMGVKASGGIRDLAAALRMIEAGANRLGTSAGVSIVHGLSGTSGY